MPRAFAAMGVAVLFAGCGKVSFGPLDVGGIGDQGPVDMGPLDTGMPPLDMGFPEVGPPVDAGPCNYLAAPTYPDSFTGVDWPFWARTDAERLVVYKRVFYDTAVTKGCNAPNCHGQDPAVNAMSSAPLIPVTEPAATDPLLARAIQEFWERLSMSNDNPISGPLYAHHRDYGITDAIAEEVWDDDPPNANADKLMFVTSVLGAARNCHNYYFVNSVDPAEICDENGGGGDAGGGGPDAGDDEAGTPPDAGADQCYCPQPFQQVQSMITGDTSDCVKPTL